MFIPFGETCAVSVSLRNLKIREFALPFDWVRTTPESLIRAVDDDFKGFHEDLQLSDSKLYVTDSYGIEFPHDYPTKKQADVTTDASEEDYTIGENILVDHWMESIPAVKKKYARRIERFISLMKSDQQITIVTECRLKDIQDFNDLFLRKYNKTNIVYVVLSHEVITEEENQGFFDRGICLCEPETVWEDENGVWHTIQEERDALWKNAIVKLLCSKKIELPGCFLGNSPPVCAPTANTS